MSGTPQLVAAVHRLELPLDGELSEPWRPFPAFRGPTPVVYDMSCHASVLAPGHSPHPPHAHVEEELLIPLCGEVELEILESEDDAVRRTRLLTPGSFVYYASGQLHTIRNPGSSPVAYLMLKWRGDSVSTEPVLETEIATFRDLAPDAPFWTRVLLEGPTSSLGRLHAHLTILQPQAGYQPHRDGHDVALVLLEGTIETLGARVDPVSVVYCPAGELHGMLNAGTRPARYLVFEFHAPSRGSRRKARPSPLQRITTQLRGVASALRRPRVL